MPRRNGKLDNSASGAIAKSAMTRRGPGVKNVQSTRRNKGKQTIALSGLKGPS